MAVCAKCGAFAVEAEGEICRRCEPVKWREALVAILAIAFLIGLLSWLAQGSVIPADRLPIASRGAG
jgi:hypothetical protein